MKRLRIHVALSMFVVTATVAVFLGVAPVPFLKGEHKLPAIQSNGGDTLMADGGDPQPKPVPIPWLGEAS